MKPSGPVPSAPLQGLTPEALRTLLESLAQSPRQGVLHVTDGKQTREIGLLPDGQVLLEPEVWNPRRMGQFWLKKGKLASKEFEQLLARGQEGGKSLAERVADSTQATPEEAQELVRQRLEEELLRLCQWSGAQYRFTEGAPPGSLHPLRLRGDPVKLDWKPFVDRALQRLEDWQALALAYPLAESVFGLTESGQQSIRSSSESPLQQLGWLLDGSRSLETLIEDSPLSPFETLQLFAELHRQGGLREVAIGELRASVLQSGARSGLTTVRRIEAGLRRDPADPLYAEKMAERLKGLKKSAEAFDHYLRAARLHRQKKQSADALRCLEEARGCLPDSTSAVIALLEEMSQSDPQQSLRIEGLQAITLCCRKGDLEAATACSKILVRTFPADPELRIRSAEILLERGDLAGTLEQLEAAMPSASGAAMERVRELAGTLSARLPNDPRVRRLRRGKPQRERKATRVRLWMAAAAVAVVGTAILVAAVYERNARKLWRSLKAEAAEFEADGNLDRALERADLVSEKFPYSWISREGRAEATRLRGALEARKAKDHAWKLAEFARKRERFRDLREQEQKGPLPEVLSAYRDLAAWAKEHGEVAFTAEVESRVQRIEQYLAEAERLLSGAEQEISQGDLGKGRALIQQALARYPLAPGAAAARLPLGVESSPSGARVLLDQRPAGLTPLVLRVAPKGPVALRVELRGFLPQNRTADPAQNSVLRLLLEKELLWKFRTGGSVEAAPLIAGKLLLVPNRDAHLYAIDIESREVLWKHRAESLGDIVSTPAVANGRCYFGSNDHHVYAVDLETGKLLWKFKTGLFVQTSPVVSLDGSVVLAVSFDRFLYCIEAASGSLRWKAKLKGEPRGFLVVTDRLVLVGQDFGTVSAFEVSSGAPRWEVDLGAPCHLAAAIEDGAAFCATESGLVVSLSAKEGKAQWRQDLKFPFRAAPFVRAGTLWVAAQAGSVWSLGTRQGDPRWKTDLGGPVSGSPAANASLVAAGSDDHKMYFLAPQTGEILWTFQTQGKVKAPPAFGTDRIYFGSEDSTIYVIEP